MWFERPLCSEERRKVSSAIIYAQDLWIDVYYPNLRPASLEKGCGRKEVCKVVKDGKSCQQGRVRRAAKNRPPLEARVIENRRSPIGD